MDVSRPSTIAGMRHLALFVSDIQKSLHFYRDLIGMTIEWQPDERNIYLSSGCDNLAIHSAPDGFQADGDQRMDHLGFMLDGIDEVDRWYEFLFANQVSMRNQPRTHRDGARSFYCLDPDGNVVQMIYHPPVSGKCRN